jgi:hypothetical protein
MPLVPDAVRIKLLANGAAAHETDHVPVVKLFNPCGAATWIITEMMPDGDTLFGLADLGFGCPELGYVSLAEIESVKGPLGIGIERDLYFAPRFPLSVYAEAARSAGRITEAEPALSQAAAALGISPIPPVGGRPRQSRRTPAPPARPGRSNGRSRSHSLRSRPPCNSHTSTLAS